MCMYIYTYWFNVDALAQGSAYKPTQEPINHRGLRGPPDCGNTTSFPARSFQVTEIVSKTQSSDMADASLHN